MKIADTTLLPDFYTKDALAARKFPTDNVDSIFQEECFYDKSSTKEFWDFVANITRTPNLVFHFITDVSDYIVGYAIDVPNEFTLAQFKELGLMHFCPGEITDLIEYKGRNFIHVNYANL